MTFTPDQQKTHRAAFIHDCHYKAWSAACHADFITTQLDEGTTRYQKMQADDRALETEIKDLENAADAHMRDNREKRKAIQEKRNGLARATAALGQNLQQGQQALTDLYQSIESNLALAKHAEGYKWKEVATSKDTLG